MKTVQASACAKVILFGEHAVVYGYPAVAIPVQDIRAFATITKTHTNTPEIEADDLDLAFPLAEAKIPSSGHHIVQTIKLFSEHIGGLADTRWKLRVQSDIPISRGLGSGAAITVAILRALSKFFEYPLTQDDLVSISYEIEKMHHGRPSGIDNTVIALEKPILFQKQTEISVLRPHQQHFVIGDTGIAKNTGDIVAEVAKKRERNQKYYDDVFQKIGQIARDGFALLQKDERVSLGKLMNDNQYLLERIDVSSNELRRLIDAANQNGGLGAKLCGAGQGGCMVALAADETLAHAIAGALQKAGAQQVFLTSLK